MSEEIKNLLFSLSLADGIGHLPYAKDAAQKELSKYCTTRRVGGNVIGEIAGTGDKKIMIEAHIDQVGFIVTDVSEDGFLTVAKVGGIDLRALPSRRVTVHGKQKVEGTFCSIPPHLAKDDKAIDDISLIKIDTLLGKKAGEVISAGDYVTFCTQPAQLLGNRVTGRSFDDRAGVVCVIETARRLCGKKLPFGLCFVLCDNEELGTRGAVTSAFDTSPDAAVCVDVSFGDAPDVSENDCGALGGGCMIGLSPVLDREIGQNLIATAKENGIKYQIEVMSAATGTDADAVSVSKGGVRTGLVSIPLRNMHTDCETVDLDDIAATCDLLEKFLLGGAF